jgi:hypothetical protein
VGFYGRVGTGRICWWSWFARHLRETNSIPLEVVWRSHRVCRLVASTSQCMIHGWHLVWTLDCKSPDKNRSRFL